MVVPDSLTSATAQDGPSEAWLWNPGIKTTITIFACAFSAAVGMAASKDANRGREIFEKRCTGCHPLNRIKVGPRLRGAYGRQAGKDTDFSYSDAVRSASVVWEEFTLDRWLADTESVIPGDDMSFRLENAGEHHCLFEGAIWQMSVRGRAVKKALVALGVVAAVGLADWVVYPIRHLAEHAQSQSRSEGHERVRRHRVIFFLGWRGSALSLGGGF